MKSLKKSTHLMEGKEGKKTLKEDEWTWRKRTKEWIASVTSQGGFKDEEMDDIYH